MNEILFITPDPSRWKETKILRLEALQADPIAFGSSYEEAIQYEDAVWQKRLETAFNRDGNITLYADSDGQLVGMMGAVWSNRIKSGHIADIYGVYVTASVRGKGVGSRLMQTLLDELGLISKIEVVRLGVTTTQSDAIALYKKFGFVQIGIAHREIKIGNDYYDEYLMEKFL